METKELKSLEEKFFKKLKNVCEAEGMYTRFDKLLSYKDVYDIFYEAFYEVKHQKHEKV